MPAEPPASTGRHTGARFVTLGSRDASMRCTPAGMGIGGLRLAIDYGTTTTVAVLAWPEGRHMPLLFDGSAVLPSAVHTGPDGRLLTGTQAWQAAATTPEGFQPTPLRHIRNGTIDLGSTKVDVLDLIAATLRRVTDEATRVATQPVPDVRLVVPAGWGPRRRTLLRNAAHRAGLPTPTLIEAPIAAARHLLATGTPIADGAHLLICDLGAGFEATVLRHTGDSFDVLATIDDPDAGTLRIDRDLAAYLTDVIAAAGNPSANPGELSAGDRFMIQASARTATESLTRAPAVAVAMPSPHPPVVLTHTQLDAIARPVLEQAAVTARQAVDAAAEAGAEHLAGVYCIGEGAQLPPAAKLLKEHTTLAPTVPAEPRLAAARGATHTAGDAIVRVDTGPPPPPLRRAVALVIPGAASLGLLAHTYATATYNHAAGIGYDPYAYVLANWGELAMAATFALLTCLAAATLIASTLPALGRAPQPGTAPDPNTAISTGLLAAIAVGLSIAGLYAISGSLYFGLPSGPFLRWALIPALPIAALAATTAVHRRHRSDPNLDDHRRQLIHRTAHQRRRAPRRAPTRHRRHPRHRQTDAAPHHRRRPSRHLHHRHRQLARHRHPRRHLHRRRHRLVAALPVAPPPQPRPRYGVERPDSKPWADPFGLTTVNDRSPRRQVSKCVQCSIPRRSVPDDSLYSWMNTALSGRTGAPMRDGTRGQGHTRRGRSVRARSR